MENNNNISEGLSKVWSVNCELMYKALYAKYTALVDSSWCERNFVLQTWNLFEIYSILDRHRPSPSSKVVV